MNSNENSIDKNQKFENWKRIKVKDLNFTYPDNTKVLENINLEINNGEIIGIIGNSGSGKLLLLILLPAYYLLKILYLLTK